jgi:hypothetical protein
MTYDRHKANSDNADAVATIKERLGRSKVRMKIVGAGSERRCAIMGPRSDEHLAYVTLDERSVPMVETLDIVAKASNRRRPR